LERALRILGCRRLKRQRPRPAAPCTPQNCNLPSSIYHLPFFRGHSSVGRAPALQAGSQGFESPCLQSSLAAVAESEDCRARGLAEADRALVSVWYFPLNLISQTGQRR